MSGLFQEVEAQVSSKEGQSELEESLAGIQTRLEEIADELSQGHYSTGDLIKDLQLESTGLFDHLKIIHTSIDTYKTNKELLFYYKTKMKSDQAGDKFNVSATEKEASALTVDERRLRNLTEAYMVAAEKNIITAQSILKFLSDAYKRTEA
jgi:hypothetical protein